jgi:hypothetical protein
MSLRVHQIKYESEKIPVPENKGVNGKFDVNFHAL